MDRCALEFIARRWWRRAEVWIIAALLVTGGAVLGWQSAFWSMATTQANQVAEIRAAYDAAMAESAATKVSKAATTANQAADKADEALNRVTP